MASVQALPGIPPFDCEGCPQPSAKIMASVQALPGIPPFDCEGCPQPSVTMIAVTRDSRPHSMLDRFTGSARSIDLATAWQS